MKINWTGSATNCKWDYLDFIYCNSKERNKCIETYIFVEFWYIPHQFDFFPKFGNIWYIRWSGLLDTYSDRLVCPHVHPPLFVKNLVTGAYLSTPTPSRDCYQNKNRLTDCWWSLSVYCQTKCCMHEYNFHSENFKKKSVDDRRRTRMTPKQTDLSFNAFIIYVIFVFVPVVYTKVYVMMISTTRYVFDNWNLPPALLTVFELL